jgi:hypothetical protein
MTNLTPQQIEFASYYFDPQSATYSNALQSALKAGYSQETAENITNIMPKWLSELFGKKKRLLMKAEKNLEGILDIGVSDKDSLKVVADTSKFIAERVGKEDYSNRTELTGKDGEKLFPKPILDVQEDNSNQSNIESNQED